MHSIVAKKPGGVNVLQKIDFELPDLKPMRTEPEQLHLYH